MTHAGLGFGVEQVSVNRMARECLQCQWANKFFRAAGHNDTHLSAGILQTSDNLSAFVRGNTAADADYYSFV